MAVAYKNAGAALTTSAATVYTCPASTEAVVLLIQVSNIDGSSPADATVRWGDSSDSNTEYHLASAVEVASNDSISILSGPLHLEAGDYIEALASANNDLEITVSVMEIT
jgi:hypothetical protein